MSNLGRIVFAISWLCVGLIGYFVCVLWFRETAHGNIDSNAIYIFFIYCLCVLLYGMSLQDTQKVADDDGMRMIRYRLYLTCSAYGCILGEFCLQCDLEAIRHCSAEQKRRMLCLNILH